MDGMRESTPPRDRSRPPMSDFTTPGPFDARPGDDVDPAAPTVPVTHPVPRRTILPGTVLDGRYLIVRQIGAGGMGMVFHAEDQNVNNKPVAVKFIIKELFRPEDYTLFCQEMQTIARLDPIPGVVKVIDSNLQDPQRPYLVTEFVHGWNLETFVRDQTPTRAERVQLILDICQTLQAVHDEGVLHRDLKPSNILVRQRKLGDRWLPVLVDFGLALYRTPAAQDDLQILGGTPMFMSPEHVSSLQQITRRSDVFSLGVILYWLLTEEYPYPKMGAFDGTVPALTPKAMPAEREDEFGVRVGVPTDLARVVMKAISLRPIDRFQTAAEFAAALKQWFVSQHAGGAHVGPTDATMVMSAPLAAGDATPLHYLSSERLYSETAALLGVRIGNAKVVRFLGYGKSGLSFQCATESGDATRVKVMYPAVKSREEVTGALQRIMARTTQLNHPSIARVRGVGKLALQDGQAFYAVTDFVEGRDLIDWAADRGVEIEYGGFTAAQLNAAFTLARALHHAHQFPFKDGSGDNDLGGFHGRVCASNVIVNREKRAVLTDFGLAWLVRSVAQPRAPRDRDCREISETSELEPFSSRKQVLAQREAYALGQLLKTFLFSSGGGVPALKSPEEVWPGCGGAMVNDVRKVVRETARQGPERCRAEVERVAATFKQSVRPMQVITHLVRFAVRELTATPAEHRLTDLGKAAARIAEAAAIGAGASNEMLEVLAERR